jgi:predicted DCC family thiol-disulfide oxidoreductase YuxK
MAPSTVPFSALLIFDGVNGWRFAGWLGTAPPWSWLSELGYALVARYRHRLPGGTPPCTMPAGG